MDYHRRRKYGVSEERFLDLLTRQGFMCAICCCKIGLEACVDHSHKTGEVRGLLCRQCNLKLAIVEDADYIAAAQRYLSR